MNTQIFEQFICQLKEALYRLQSHQNNLQPCREYSPVRQQTPQQRQRLRRYYS